MGWRGAVRSIVAAQRAAEREEGRLRRELERLAKEQAKHDAHVQAALAVQAYEDHIRRLTSVHRSCGEVWDWNAHANAAEPAAPMPTTASQVAAQAALDGHSPGWLDKILGRVERRRAALLEQLRRAIDEDSHRNKAALAKHANAVEDWSELRDLAARILSNDADAFRQATDELGPFREIADLGSRIEFKFHSSGSAEVELHVNSETVIPRESLSLLQSGKLSTKKLPQGRFFELYQDYVTGAVLRIAREVFALLPLHTVLVTAYGNLLDESTGHMADRAILSVVLPRSTLDKLRFEALDPSDSLRNFRHRMDFKKSAGFVAIEPYTIEACLEGSPVPSPREGSYSRSRKVFQNNCATY